VVVVVCPVSAAGEVDFGVGVDGLDLLAISLVCVSLRGYGEGREEGKRPRSDFRSSSTWAASSPPW